MLGSGEDTSKRVSSHRSSMLKHLVPNIFVTVGKLIIDSSHRIMGKPTVDCLLRVLTQIK